MIEASVDEFLIIKTLGEGNFSKVKLAVNQEKKLFALKIFKSKFQDSDRIQHQYNLISSLNHPNIIRVFENRLKSIYKKFNGKIKQKAVLVLQYAQNGELFETIKLIRNFSQATCRTYFIQLIKTVNFMHQNKIFHRDLKPENLLFDSNFELKIADFGLSKYSEENQMKQKLSISMYSAPQVSTQCYDAQKVDLFSCGVILFVMYTSRTPFRSTFSYDNLYCYIKQKDFDKFWNHHTKNTYPFRFSANFKNLINNMLTHNSKQRYNFQEIMHHPWVQEQLCQFKIIENQLRSKIAKKQKILE